MHATQPLLLQAEALELRERAEHAEQVGGGWFRGFSGQLSCVFGTTLQARQPSPCLSLALGPPSCRRFVRGARPARPPRWAHAPLSQWVGEQTVDTGNCIATLSRFSVTPPQDVQRSKSLCEADASPRAFHAPALQGEAATALERERAERAALQVGGGLLHLLCFHGNARLSFVRCIVLAAAIGAAFPPLGGCKPPILTGRPTCQAMKSLRLHFQRCAG